MTLRRLVSTTAVTTALALAAAGGAEAGLIALPQATFGGSGIPNTAVAVTTTGDLTLGLTATQRYANPPLTNNGIDTFYATPGGDILNAKPAYGVWNFDFYTSRAASNATDVVFIDLLYDFDPAFNTPALSLGRVAFSLSQGQTAEDSWNLGMGFLDTVLPGITPPTFPSFDPNATGQYSFALVARNAAGAELGRTSIQVEVVPEPATLGLIGLGLVALARRARRN